MALTVVNNIASFAAQKALSSSTTHLQNALNSLSTGLRINSAADDPSGLAISERFRSQIRGLERATSNALDAQSMLQTAEGSLGETHAILQRMRELAVQAANGVLTASDRQEVQREVDQLKEEINRIANTTEFNTKKLLDGSSTALWSANNSDIEAVIRGKVAEGNYKLVKSAEPLSNQVLKTDIFRLKDGAISQAEEGSPNQMRFTFGGSDATIDGTGASTLTFRFNFDGVNNIDVSLNSASGDAALLTDARYLVDALNANATISQYVEVELVSNSDIIIRSKGVTDESDNYTLQLVTGGGGASAVAAWQANITNWSGDELSSTQATNNLFTSAVRFADFDQIEGTVNSGVTGTFGTDRTTAAQNKVIQYVSNAENLEGGDYEILTLSANDFPSGTAGGIGAVDSAWILGAHRQSSSTGEIVTLTASVDENQYVIVEVTGAGGSGVVDLKVSWDQGETWTNVGNYHDGTSINKTTGDPANWFSMDLNGDLATGDRFLFGLQDQLDTTSNYARLTGPANDWSTSLTADLTEDYENFNHGLWQDLGANPGEKTHTLTLASMDEEGRVTFGTLDATWGMDDDFESRSSNIKILAGGDVAGLTTELSKIDRFYDSSGNFVLGDSGKWIDVYTADGDNASFYVDGGDTVQELADKLEQIISLTSTSQNWDGLGLGTVLDSDGENHVVDFVTNATENSDEAVEGTMIIRSPKQGVNGYLYFSAEEDLLNALSLATIQDPKEDIDPLTVTVYNAHTGELIGEDTVSDNVLHGVIQGVDVMVDANVDISYSWNEDTREIDFYSSEGVQEEYLHVVDNSVNFQIGANPGQVMEAYITQMDTVGLGVQNVLVVNQETASDAMSTIDDAIQRVSSERARLGAYVNRLDFTISNLAVQEENQIAAESLIRDLDMAKAISEMTQYQVLQQVGVAMLAQANTLPQMVLSLLR